MSDDGGGTSEHIRVPKKRAGSDNGSNWYKRDLEIERRLATIESSLSHTATKNDIESIKTLVAQTETKLTRWMIGLLFSTIGLFATAVIALIIGLLRTFTGT